MLCRGAWLLPIGPPKVIEARDFILKYRFLLIFLDFGRILLKIMFLYMEIGLEWAGNTPEYV